MAQGRSLLQMIFKNFINSLKPRKFWGELKGKDHFGTEYFEAPESSHTRKPRRWFTPADRSEVQHQIPSEWLAWLTHNRKDPPTEEEIQFNIQRMKNTTENAKRLEIQRNKTVSDSETVSSSLRFPKYKDYDLGPNNIQERKDSS